MENNELIPAGDFCLHHNIEMSFIHELEERGLIETTLVETQTFLYPGTLSQLERMVRLHYDLDINMEGLESISHLLQRLNGLQTYINRLQNRLRRYEE